jgi:replicative DNA helicase
VRARYTVAGKVRIDLPDDARWQLRGGAQMSVVVNRQDFDELVKVIQAGDAEKAEQARALDEARADIRRLTDDRDRWDVDELRATVVRQANEITALKGESA